MNKMKPLRSVEKTLEKVIKNLCNHQLNFSYVLLYIRPFCFYETGKVGGLIFDI